MTPNRYDARFAQLREEGHKAFIPFTLLGWPDVETSFEIIKSMIESGVSALELGLAFSDPVADGPIIQSAAFETLATGFKVRDAWELVKRVRALDAEIPIGLLVYYNMVLARGVETFFKEAAEAGVDGVLIADLPPEAGEEVAPIANKYGVVPIFIVSPLTTDERLSFIASHGGGFLYAVSRLGITGTEERYDEALADMITRTQTQTRLPLCVGFGISTPEQGRNMLNLGADGVITGSRIIQLVREARDASQPVDTTLRKFLDEMVQMSREFSVALPG